MSDWFIGELAYVIYLATMLSPLLVAIGIAAWGIERRADQDREARLNLTSAAYEAYKAERRRERIIRGALALLAFIVVAVISQHALSNAARIGARIQAINSDG